MVLEPRSLFWSTFRSISRLPDATKSKNDELRRRTFFPKKPHQNIKKTFNQFLHVIFNRNELNKKQQICFDLYDRLWPISEASFVQISSNLSTTQSLYMCTPGDCHLSNLGDEMDESDFVLSPSYQLTRGWAHQSDGWNWLSFWPYGDYGLGVWKRGLHES